MVRAGASVRARFIAQWSCAAVLVAVLSACAARGTDGRLDAPGTGSEPEGIERPAAATLDAPLPADPQRVAIDAGDGVTYLDGTYYPAAQRSAPVVVLFHGYGGSMHDWDDVALWLQNRSEADGGGERSVSGWDASGFPAVPSGRSYAVLTVSFVNQSGSVLPEAKAGFRFARTLPGVDPERIVTAGASIGADAAVDVCSEGCVGAFALSPGSFLGPVFADEVARINAGMKPALVHCLASEKDGLSPGTCRSGSGGRYRITVFDGRAHGMSLLDPALRPSVPVLWLDFLLEATGE